MKQLSMTLVFDLSKYESAESIQAHYSHHDEKYGFVNYSMNFGKGASLAESSLRSRLRLNAKEMRENTGLRISHPRSIICFNYKTLKHEFYKAANFDSYIKPEGFRYPANFGGSPIKELLKY